MNVLVPLLLLISAIAGFFYYIQPGYTEIQAQRKDIAQYDNALEKAQEFAKIRDELIGKLNSFQTTDIERLKHMIPDNVDSTKLVIEMNEIARRHGLDITNIRVSEMKQQGAQGVASRGDKYNTLSLGFNVSTNYENLVNFLRDLESNLRLADVSNLTIGTGNSSGGAYSVDLTVRTYWLKPVQ